MSEGTPKPQFRLSDAEREHAAQRLQRAMSEGRITLDEFDQRSAAVYAATFASDLEPLFADLPPEGVGWNASNTPAPIPAAPPANISARPGAVGGVDISQVAFPAEPVVIDAGWSTVRRKDRWLVPGWLRLKTGPGTIVLDCREATFAQQVIAIDVEVGMGTIKIIVPEGVTADVNGVSAGLGTVTSKVDALPSTNHPHLVCAGKVGAGTFLVRNPYF